MPLKAMISHSMTWLTITAPGAYGETAVRPSRQTRVEPEDLRKARLTRGALELLSGPTSLMKRLRPEWAGSNVPWLALALRKVALEAWSSRSGPLSVYEQSKVCWFAPARENKLYPSPYCYHVVHKAFVDGNEECLVGEFIIQEVQEVQTSLGGIGIAQQQLGG